MKSTILKRGGVAAMLLTAALVLSACSSGGGSASSSDCKPAPKGTKVTLTFSSWIPNFQKTVDLWNSTHPDIQVKYTEVTAGNNGTYQNYLNQIKSGKTGDLGFIDYDVLPTFKSQGGLRNFYNCANVASVKKDFLPAIWNQTSLGESNTAYGLGLDFGPDTLFYRTDLFKQAGIDAPKTWDEYYEDAKKVRALGGYIGNFDNNCSTFWPGLWMQDGVNWFSQKDGTWKVNIDSPAAKKAADYMQKLLDEKLVSTYPCFQDEYSKALDSGQIWSQIGGPWATALISTSAADTAGKWGVASGPTWTAGGDVGVFGGASMAMFKGSKHPYEAAEFATWATTNPKALALNAVEGGLYPPVKNVVQKVPALQKGLPFYGGQAVFQDIENGWASKVSTSWIYGPTMVQVNADINTQIGKAIAGDQTVYQALQAIQASTVQAMTDQGIKVAK